MDFQTIKDLGTLITLGIAIYTIINNGGKSIKQNTEKITEQFTKLNWKQDENCRTLASMDKNLDKLGDKVEGFNTRITILETQVKQLMEDNK